MGSFEDIFGDYFEAYKTTLQYKDDSKMEIMFRRQEFEKNLDDMPYLFDNLKLSSFFSGIGAFEIALDRLYKGINSGNFINPQTE